MTKARVLVPSSSSSVPWVNVIQLLSLTLVKSTGVRKGLLVSPQALKHTHKRGAHFRPRRGHVIGAGDDEAGFVDGGEDEVSEGSDGLLLDEAARHRGGEAAGDE